jgi:predicted transcriptional regulator
MQAKREYRDRDGTEVAVLDALVDRHEDGMTVFEIRSRVDVGIDRIEEALGELKAAGLIAVEKEGGQTRIYPDDRVVPSGEEDLERSFAQKLREKLPF